MMKSRFLILLNIFCLIRSFIHSSTEGYEPQLFKTAKKKLDNRRLNTIASLDLDSLQRKRNCSMDTLLLTRFQKKDVNKQDKEQERKQLKKTTKKQLNNKRFNIDTFIDLGSIQKSNGHSSMNTDVYNHDEEQEQQLKKICQNKINQFTFTLPNSNKSLTFKYDKIELVDFMFVTGWVLTHINEEKVYLTDISFTTFPIKQSVYLNTLYPGYPKISGIDIMQFLMTLCHTCEYVFEIMDASDLSTPYMFLHNQNYYESVINGKNEIMSENNRPIDQNEFLNCVNEILLDYRIIPQTIACQSRLKTCKNEENNLRPENCPITTPWLGRFLHKTIFPACFYAPIISCQPAQYSISTKNLHDILNKPFIKQQNSYKVELKIKDYSEMLEGCQRDQLFFNLMNSFQICIEDTLLKEQKLNPFNIWKSTFPCVTDRVDSFLKYYI